MSEFFIFSPYPGSPHWRRLESQNRITSREWRKYNGAHVVFEPAKMSAQRLRGEFVNCWKGFYEMNQSRNLAQMEPSVWRGEELKVSKRLEARGVGREAAVTGIGIVSPLRVLAGRGARRAERGSGRDRLRDEARPLAVRVENLRRGEGF